VFSWLASLMGLATIVGAFAAGLGTFSLHEAFISEAGCNIRLASVITDAPLEITPRKGDEPFSSPSRSLSGPLRWRTKTGSTVQIWEQRIS